MDEAQMNTEHSKEAAEPVAANCVSPDAVFLLY